MLAVLPWKTLLVVGYGLRCALGVHETRLIRIKRWVARLSWLCLRQFTPDYVMYEPVFPPIHPYARACNLALLLSYDPEYVYYGKLDELYQQLKGMSLQAIERDELWLEDILFKAYVARCARIRKVIALLRTEVLSEDVARILNANLGVLLNTFDVAPSVLSYERRCVLACLLEDLARQEAELSGALSLISSIRELLSGNPVSLSLCPA